MVNFELEIYLTDFQESTFVGEIAKNRGFCGGEIFEDAPIYHSGINHAPALLRGTRLGTRSYGGACGFSGLY